MLVSLLLPALDTENQRCKSWPGLSFYTTKRSLFLSHTHKFCITYRIEKGGFLRVVIQKLFCLSSVLKTFSSQFGNLVCLDHIPRILTVMDQKNNDSKLWLHVLSLSQCKDLRFQSRVRLNGRLGSMSAERHLKGTACILCTSCSLHIIFALFCD